MAVPDPIDEARRQWIDHGWTDAASGMVAVITIVRMNQILMAQVETALRPHGLTFSRFEVLRLLAFTREGGLPMGKLTDRLQVHPASMTNAVDRLEADGFAKRLPNPSDSRSTIVKILPAGRRRLEPATRDLNALFLTLGGSKELDALTTTLRRLGRRWAALSST